MEVLTKKIKAFTIAELLVVLAISGIVISLAMLMLSLIQKQIRIINTNYDYAAEVRLLENALWKDFNRHDLYFNSKKQQLQCISEIDTITYSFTANYTVRNTNTLQVPIFTTMGFLNGSVSVNTAVDAIELRLTKEQSTKKVFISKTKDGAFYIN